uniref:Chromosome 8 open reading frame 58 n=2 Tax=Aotus nancymaae TaxID=37293 RepID=A0A2K5DAD9_AOTNA
MLGRRRAFAVDGRDGAGEGLAWGCIVPGVTSTYRRIPDAAHGCSSWERGDKLSGVGREAQFLKLASRDSGVEMAVGDSPLAALPGLCQDSLDFDSSGSPEPLAQVGGLLASQKLEQVLERSHRLPAAPASLTGHRPLQPPSKPECEVPLFGAGEQESTEADTDLESGLEEEAVGGLGPGAWACLPGQGLRYLEHLCLVLEQMARLQQLYLQLRIQRPPGDPDGEELARAPLPSPLHTQGNGGQGPWELLSQTEQTGAKAASPTKVEVPSANPPRLPEALVEPMYHLPSSQGYKRDFSHWDKVKVLLNRICRRSHHHPEPPAPPDGSGPRIQSRDLPERPQCHPHQKTFMPSLVVKKQRAKNLSVC